MTTVTTAPADHYARNGIALEVDIGEWTTARDGSLTTRSVDGRWFADCSVPLLAGRAMLTSVRPSHLAVCLLAPPHAGVVVAARERLGRRCPILIVQPDTAAVRQILGAIDLSDDLRSMRLCIVTGPDWPERLRALYDAHPGLATPSQFVKTKLVTDAEADAMMDRARAVFTDVAADRSRRLEEIRHRPTRSPSGSSGRYLLVGGGDFRLWNPGLPELTRLLAGVGALHDFFPRSPLTQGAETALFDADDPLSTSPLALAIAASDARCVVTVDVYRQDIGAFIDDRTPIVTRATRPSPAPSTNPLDAVLVPDRTWATDWPADRVAVVPWSMPRVPIIGHKLGLIGDTKTIQPPESVRNFSSHVLLWDGVEFELRDRPLAAADAGRYLGEKIAAAGIDPSTVDQPAFVDDLIVPSFQQGVARILIRAGLPVACYGEGWTHLDEFLPFAHGPIDTEADFAAALAACRALVHHWPTVLAHPIDAVGRLVVRATDADQSGFVRRAKAALSTDATSTDRKSCNLPVGRSHPGPPGRVPSKFIRPATSLN